MVSPRKDEKPLLLHLKELPSKQGFFTVMSMVTEVGEYGNRGRRQQGKADHGSGFCEGRERHVKACDTEGEFDSFLRMFFH